MAYPYTEETYAKLLAAAAKETQAVMRVCQMLDDVKPSRTDVKKRKAAVMGVLKRASVPLTVEEMAETLYDYSEKSVRETVRVLAKSGTLVRGVPKLQRIGTGKVAQTYLVASESHG